MAAAAVSASTNRSCTATLDAALEWTPWVYIHGNQQLDIILNATGFTGTIRLSRSLVAGDATFLDVTDDLGNIYEWTGAGAFTGSIGTPVLRAATPARYRLHMPTNSAGSVAVELRGGNRN